MSGSGPDLAVGKRVVADVVRMAAAETPGVWRVARGSFWARLVGRRPIDVKVADGVVDVRIHLVARPDVSLASTGDAVRSAVAAAIGRVLGLGVGSVTVIVDGVRG